MTRKREEVYINLKALFQDVFDDEEITVNDATIVGNIDDWDSLEYINLIVEIEERFIVRFSMGEVNRFKMS